MELLFYKLHGLGNDFVVVNYSDLWQFCKEYIDTDTTFENDTYLSSPLVHNLFKTMCTRHWGIGADGILVIRPISDDHSKQKRIEMRVFNADGSEAEMCGNGVRCAAKYAFDHGLIQGSGHNVDCVVETLAGPCQVTICLSESDTNQANTTVASVRVCMGIPKPLHVLQESTDEHIESLCGTKCDNDYVVYDKDTIMKIATTNHEDLSYLPEDCRVVSVDMGNPHAVVLTSNDIHTLPLKKIATAFQSLAIYSQGVNVHLTNVLSKPDSTGANIHVRTWERGSGATLACGSGACAVCVATLVTNSLKSNDLNSDCVVVQLPGGCLSIQWRRFTDNKIYMTGPARTVFRGFWQPQEV